MHLELASPERWRHLPKYLQDQGYYDEHRGFGQVRFCSPQYLRDSIREIFEIEQKKKDDSHRILLHIHTLSDNTIHEGCKSSGWTTSFIEEEKQETFCCSQAELGSKNFKISDIISFSY